ncbi:MAG: hypothetical protein ACK5LV_05045, partial [Lachnospirales bacterium]
MKRNVKSIKRITSMALLPIMVSGQVVPAYADVIQNDVGNKVELSRDVKEVTPDNGLLLIPTGSDGIQKPDNGLVLVPNSEKETETDTDVVTPNNDLVEVPETDTDEPVVPISPVTPDTGITTIDDMGFEPSVDTSGGGSSISVQSEKTHPSFGIELSDTGITSGSNSTNVTISLEEGFEPVEGYTYQVYRTINEYDTSIAWDSTEVNDGWMYVGQLADQGGRYSYTCELTDSIKPVIDYNVVKQGDDVKIDISSEDPCSDFYFVVVATPTDAIPGVWDNILTQWNNPSDAFDNLENAIVNSDESVTFADEYTYFISEKEREDVFVKPVDIILKYKLGEGSDWIEKPFTIDQNSTTTINVSDFMNDIEGFDYDSTIEFEIIDKVGNQGSTGEFTINDIIDQPSIHAYLTIHDSEEDVDYSINETDLGIYYSNNEDGTITYTVPEIEGYTYLGYTLDEESVYTVPDTSETFTISVDQCEEITFHFVKDSDNTATPDITLPEVDRPDWQDPDITLPEVDRPDWQDPDITLPEVDRPDWQDPDIT